LQLAGAVVFLAVITGVAVWQIGRRPYFAVGWFWFVGTLVPVIGLVQVGSQSLADRYTYVPYFGLFIIIVFGAAELVQTFRIPVRVLAVFAGLILIALSMLSFRQAGYWRDNETLYGHTLAVTKNNYLISHNLCHYLAFADRLDEGEKYCRDAIAIRPDYFEPYNTLGVIYSKRADFAAAESEFSRAIERRPDYAVAYSNLAVAQAQQGKADEAEISLQKALAHSGDVPNQAFPAILADIAATFAKQKRYDKAAENYRRQLSLTPNDLRSQAQLAKTLYFRGELDEAEKWAANVVAIDPNSPDALNVLGLVSLERGRFKDASLAFKKLVAVAPDFESATENLEKAESGIKNAAK
jgi:tetratricopeptide (TPR) repeat protein